MAHNIAKNAVDRDVFGTVHPLKLPPHPPPPVDTPASTSRYTRLHHHKVGAWFAAKEEPGLSKRRSLVCPKGGAWFAQKEEPGLSKRRSLVCHKGGAWFVQKEEPTFIGWRRVYRLVEADA